MAIIAPPHYNLKPSVSAIFFKHPAAELDECARSVNYTSKLDNLSKLCEEGKLEQALEIFKQRGILVGTNNAYCLLQECIRRKDLQCARQLEFNIENGIDSISILCDQLIRLFATCGNCTEAALVFSKTWRPSVYTCNAIILALANHGLGETALELYHRLEILGIKCNNYLFVSILKACSQKLDLYNGRLVHERIIENRAQFDIYVGSTLIDMYGNSGNLEDALCVFQNLQDRNVVTWGTMVESYAKHGKDYLALDFFVNMQYEGVKPDKVIFLSILKACGNLGVLTLARYIHVLILKTGLKDDVLGNALIDMYLKCASVEEAERVLYSLANQDVVSWGTMIAGYVHCGDDSSSFSALRKMQDKYIKPNRSIFLSTLKACTSIGSVEYGRFIHEQLIESSFLLETLVGNAIVDMYIKCGSLNEARYLFDKLLHRDVVSWSSMISGYTQHCECRLALQYFENMNHEGIRPNNITFSSILKACGTECAIEHGRCIHAQISESKIHFDVVLGNSLLDMYSKCGYLEEARKVFDEMPNRDVISWALMISGYTHHTEGFLALECYGKMQNDGIKPDKITFLSVCKACASTGAVHHGRDIHRQVKQSSLQYDIVVGNTIVDMYAKCGSLKEAEYVFNRLINPSVVSWNALVAGYAQIGDVHLALKSIESMCYEGVRPDDVTLTAVLSACSHAGLVDEGCLYFTSMTECHGMQPNIFHYNCIIDLLSHAGYLEEGEAFLQASMQASLSGWMTLLSRQGGDKSACLEIITSGEDIYS